MQTGSEKQIMNSIIKRVSIMKLSRNLLVSILCLMLLFASCAQICVSAEGLLDQVIDWAVLRTYFVHITDEANVEDYALPDWSQPEWTLVSENEQGKIYYLFCVINGSQSDAFAAILAETMTEEQGVIEYVPEREHPQMGDTNADGQIGADDALLCLQAVVGKYHPQSIDEYMRFLVPDYTNSGGPIRIDAACALNILKMVVGKY